MHVAVRQCKKENLEIQKQHPARGKGMQSRNLPVIKRLRKNHGAMLMGGEKACLRAWGDLG